MAVEYLYVQHRGGNRSGSYVADSLWGHRPMAIVHGWRRITTRCWSCEAIKTRGANDAGGDESSSRTRGEKTG